MEQHAVSRTAVGELQIKYDSIELSIRVYQQEKDKNYEISKIYFFGSGNHIPNRC